MAPALSPIEALLHCAGMPKEPK